MFCIALYYIILYCNVLYCTLWLCCLFVATVWLRQFLHFHFNSQSLGKIYACLGCARSDGDYAQLAIRYVIVVFTCQIGPWFVVLPLSLLFIFSLWPSLVRQWVMLKFNTLDDDDAPLKWDSSHQLLDRYATLPHYICFHYICCPRRIFFYFFPCAILIVSVKPLVDDDQSFWALYCPTSCQYKPFFSNGTSFRCVVCSVIAITWHDIIAINQLLSRQHKIVSLSLSRT